MQQKCSEFVFTLYIDKNQIFVYKIRITHLWDISEE